MKLFSFAVALLIMCSISLFTTAQTTKGHLLGVTEKGISLYQVKAKKGNKITYYGIGKDGQKYTAKKARPIKPGTVTPIPADCDIECIKNPFGKDKCYLVCPSHTKH